MGALHTMNWDTRIIDLWAEHYRLPDHYFHTSGGSIYTYPAEPTDTAATLLYTDHHSILALPEARRNDLTAAPTEILSPAALATALPHVDIVVNETLHVFYWTHKPPTPKNPAALRQLSVADTDIIRQLQAACSAYEIQLGQIEPDDPLIVGYFEDDHLAGIGSLLYWSHDIADIGIITHPAYRGHGIGADITAELSRLGMAVGKIMQYRTLSTNAGSIAVARRMGFQLFINIAELQLAQRQM